MVVSEWLEVKEQFYCNTFRNFTCYCLFIR
jgi:hypothetical protein